MIIELFGAPGAGKTTFATAFASRLRQSGHAVELVMSYRPVEITASPQTPAQRGFLPSSPDGLRRMSRAAIEIISPAIRARGGSEATELTEALLRLLPPRNILWSIRLRQYMLRLCGVRNRATAANHIMLFDQGFIQAVCSFVLLSRTGDLALAQDALDLIPKPDRSILLSAPPEILRARLEQRNRHQGRFERWLELTIDENMRSIAIASELCRLLRRQRGCVTDVDSSDQHSIAMAAGELVKDLSRQKELALQ
jgi:broad-specificity NMP kinase